VHTQFNFTQQTKQLDIILLTDSTINRLLEVIRQFFFHSTIIYAFVLIRESTLLITSEVKIKQEQKPDHGENFVPGSEAAPGNLAPQALDHFKRGYKERADLRNRETNQVATEFDDNAEQYPPTLGLPDERPQVRSNHNHHRHNHHHNHHHPPMQRTEFRTSYRGSSGFDAMRLVDTLTRPGCNLHATLDQAQENYAASFQSGKALTAILSNLARRRNMSIASFVWQWMDQRDIQKNVFHYNSLISVCEKVKNHKRALHLLGEMEKHGIRKNEVTFSSAISACEKAGQWRVALDLLERMKREGVGRTAIAYNAAISACEKGLVPHKALELFEQMKRENVTPTVITYSALISAAEKGQQWKLALEVLEEMKASGHGPNVIAYSAAISALSKGQMWEKALELFREIESSGNTPSIVTYNATMTALEKGLQWERALDLFDEMKSKRLAITVVSYGSAISACEKGLQYRQCLEYLDEMTELGIKKNVIIFGAAMSCMEKCCRADIAFQLMDRMKIEGVIPNVHIFNSAISACARCGLWEKGLELFEEMETAGVARDVVSFNAVLDAVSSQVRLGRRLFELGIEKGFYARVSRLGTQWLELDLHFLSLGGGEIALGWWFEECLVPYLVNTSKLSAVKSIDIVTGYGKTRMRGVRHGDDGMRKRVRGMLEFMNIKEVDQANKGRIHIDKETLIEEVKKNGGKVIFDQEGFTKFKEQNTTANHIPNIVQQVRPRFRPTEPLILQDDGRRSSSFQKHRERSDFSNGNDFHRNKRRGSSDYRVPHDNDFDKKHRRDNWGNNDFNRGKPYNARNDLGSGDRNAFDGDLNARHSFSDANERISQKKLQQSEEYRNEGQGNFQGDWRNSQTRDDQYRGLIQGRQGRRSSDLTDYRSRKPGQGQYHQERKNMHLRGGTYDAAYNRSNRQDMSFSPHHNSHVDSKFQNQNGDYHLLQPKQDDNCSMKAHHRDEVQNVKQERNQRLGDSDQDQFRQAESAGNMRIASYGKFERSPVKHEHDEYDARRGSLVGTRGGVQIDSKNSLNENYNKEEWSHQGNQRSVSDTNRRQGQKHKDFNTRNDVQREIRFNGYGQRENNDRRHRSRSRERFDDEVRPDIQETSRYGEEYRGNASDPRPLHKESATKKRGYDVESSTTSFSARGF